MKKFVEEHMIRMDFIPNLLKQNVQQINIVFLKTQVARTVIQNQSRTPHVLIIKHNKTVTKKKHVYGKVSF